VTPTTYYNTEQTGSATCPSGSPTETATIAAGLYSSTVSQLAANQAAQNAANQAAQALLAGQCSNSTPPVVAAQLSGLLWQLPLVQDYYETTTPVQTVTAQAVTIPAAIGAAFTIPVASTNGFSGGGITVNGYPLTVTNAGFTALTAVSFVAANCNVSLAAGSVVYQLAVGVSSCPQYMAQSLTVGGTVGETYSITLRLCGVIELKVYGTSIKGTLTGTVVESEKYISASSLMPTDTSPGGIDPSNGSNEYILVVSEPQQTYFLNVTTDSADMSPQAVDFNLTIQATPGAVVSLLAFSIDNSEYPNANSAATTYTMAGFLAPALGVSNAVQISVSNSANLVLGNCLMSWSSAGIYYNVPLFITSIDSPTLIHVANLWANVGLDVSENAAVKQGFSVTPTGAPALSSLIVQPVFGQFLEMDVSRST
jgi:hypothetical protein